MGARAVIDAVATKLATVDEVGVIMKYVRWSDDWGALFGFYEYEHEHGRKQIRGWNITRVEAHYETHPQNSALIIGKRHQIVMSGFMSIEDANESERAFQDLVDRVLDTFVPPDDSYYDGLALTGAIRTVELPEANPIENRSFGANILVHYAEIRVNVLEYNEAGACVR